MKYFLIGGLFVGLISMGTLYWRTNYQSVPQVSTRNSLVLPELSLDNQQNNQNIVAENAPKTDRIPSVTLPETVPSTPDPTGFVTLKSSNIEKLKTELDQKSISYDEVDNLDILKVKRDQAAQLAGDPLVDQIAPEVTYKTLRTPNDTSYTSQTYLNLIQAPTAWDIQTGSSSVIVGVIDTGIDATHEDLSGRIIAGYNFVNDSVIASGVSSDDNGHGTQVAGIIAASSNNAKGIAGMDWNAKLMPLKAISRTGEGTDTQVASAVRYAADHGAQIINMSIGGTFSQTLKDQINYAWSKNILIVGAVGNSGDGTIVYPAGWEEVLAIGSVNGSGNRSTFSSYGNHIDVMAPGENIITTANTGGYVTVSGTSMATPFATGALALLKAHHPGIDKNDAYNTLKDSAQDMETAGFDTKTGKGLLKVRSALDRYRSYTHTIVSQSDYPTLQPNQAANLRLTVKNTGKTTWLRSVVKLGTDRGRDRVPLFIRESGPGSPYPSGWAWDNRVFMQEQSVAPGETASFNFWMQEPSGMGPGTYREYFRLVADGVGWMEDYGLYWDIKVLSNQEINALKYRHQYVSSNGFPTINRGQAANLIVVVKNTGTETWQRGRVNLGTNQPRDRIPLFLRESGPGSPNPSGWGWENRVVMQEQSVAPGQNATFNFWVQTTSGMAPGTYREDFRLVAEGIGWLEDYGIYWDVKVY